MPVQRFLLPDNQTVTRSDDSVNMVVINRLDRIKKNESDQFMAREYLANGTLSPLRYLWVPDALHFYARYDADTCPSFVGAAAGLAQQVAQAHATG